MRHRRWPAGRIARCSLRSRRGPPWFSVDNARASAFDASGGYAALWLGALLAAAGELPNALPPPLEELARAYFEAHPPEVKA